MIIDFHTHCFPDVLAPRALSRLSASAGSQPLTDGTVAGTVRAMTTRGIDLSVVCNIATNPHQMEKVNDFAIAVNDYSPRLIALGSLHPDATPSELERQLDHLCDHDIRGVKVHPEYAGYYIDEAPWRRLFAAVNERGMFLVTHAGLDFISPDRIAVTPARLARVLDDLPTLRVVAAHLGGVCLWNEVREHLCGRDNLYFDTAIVAREKIPPSLALDIIRTHGVDRILFGSDMPWSDPAVERDFLRSLPLTEEELTAILGGNAERLLFQ